MSARVSRSSDSAPTARTGLRVDPRGLRAVFPIGIPSVYTF